MKKLGVLLGTIALLATLMALPASAVHHVTNCDNRQRTDPNTGDQQQRTICLSINTNDVFLGEKIQGLLDYNTSPNGGTPFIGIEIDFLHLWRCHPDCEQVRGNDQGWKGSDLWYQSTQTQSSDQFHTYWYDLCQNPDGGTFKVTAQYRIQWLALPGDPVGQWFDIATAGSVEHC